MQQCGSLTGFYQFLDNNELYGTQEENMSGIKEGLYTI